MPYKQTHVLSGLNQAFPAATDDVIAVWQPLIKNHDPAKVAMFDTSSGGNLTLSTIFAIARHGYPIAGRRCRGHACSGSGAASLS